MPEETRVDINGWVYINIRGEPYKRGYQHGFLLGKSIKESIERVAFWGKRDLGRPWSFFREAAEALYIPKIPREYKDELEGIRDGAKELGVDIDYTDLVAYNGYEDTYTYHYWLKAGKKTHIVHHTTGCSAFIVTGSATKSGEIVMAHNTWWPYLIGSFWNVLMHVQPEKGNQIFMQTSPGFIMSGTDWYINSAGLMVTETTITGMTTFNPEGTPNFVRVRRATQYGNDLDEWKRMMVEDNNGGLANDWLLGNAKTGEIAILELGTFNYMFEKKRDGYYIGCNIALDPEVRKETEFNYEDKSTSPMARYIRLNQLMNDHQGQIGVGLAKRLLADHYDVSNDTETPSSCTPCGHVDLDARGFPEYEWASHYPGGSFDGKVTCSSLAEKGAMWVKWGKPCNTDFIANRFLSIHPEYKDLGPFLRDIRSHPWTYISVNF